MDTQWTTISGATCISESLMPFFTCTIQGCVLLVPPYLKVSTFNFQIFASHAQIFFKCLTNFSFFVNNRDTLIHSFAAFYSYKHLHWYQLLLFWGISRNTKGEYDFKRYLVIAYMQNIFWQIPADLVRSLQIFTYSNSCLLYTSDAADE